MLWLITGSIGSGKSQFARRLAESVGKEGILIDCTAFPSPAEARATRTVDRLGTVFQWLHAEADVSLAAKLRSVNRESNPFMADRRVLVVDSLSGWLRRAIRDARASGTSPDEAQHAVGSAFDEIENELLSYQGKLIVVTEEPVAGLGIDEWEIWYACRLAKTVRELSERSRAVYRLTAGIAAEVRGYRVKQEEYKHENLYKNGR